jgi:hypothetical protein
MTVARSASQPVYFDADLLGELLRAKATFTTVLHSLEPKLKHEQPAHRR